jgi:hypothetical protein
MYDLQIFILSFKTLCVPTFGGITNLLGKLQKQNKQFILTTWGQESQQQNY